MKAGREAFVYSALFFFVFILHASTLGPTDDEAYYWVLSQNPGWGFAYHPPAVAWILWLSQKIWGWLLPVQSSFVLRFPSVFFSALIFWFILRWIQEVHGDRLSTRNAAALLITFAGLFSGSWMIVPDTSFYLGWFMSFYGTWRVCFNSSASAARSRDFALIVGGVFLACISKFTGVFVLGSTALTFLLWGKNAKWKGLLVTLVGFALSLIPVLVWNAQNEWGQFTYQFQDRHGELRFDSRRFLRFWLIQLAIAGPATWFFLKTFFGRVLSSNVKSAQYLWVWAMPGIIFLVQPGWSDFKLHWSLCFWLPIVLDFIVKESRNPTWLSVVHKFLGGFLLLAFYLSCHLPIVPMGFAIFSDIKFDPRWDVANDMYGWGELPELLQQSPEWETIRNFPIIGSRYQTASQLAMSFYSRNPVTLLPRHVREKNEWPDLGVVDHSGPDWPALLKPVLYIGDNRYDAAPEFKNADCKLSYEFETKRLSLYVSKKFNVWICHPKNG